MSEIVPLGCGLAGREARALGRQLARVDGHAKVELARIDAESTLQAARVHGAVDVTRQAMHGVTFISELEAQLGDLVPEARDRIQGIANIGCLTIAEIVTETSRRVSG